MSDDDMLSPAHPIPLMAGTEMASLRFVRMSLAQKVQELLSLLEDKPFCVVSQQDLQGTDNYDSVTKCLHQHYTPDRNKLERQYKLQTRTQKPGERLADFAGALRVLAEKAYPKWSMEQPVCHPGHTVLLRTTLADARDA